jgi:aspartate carbamoyltransferase catalytic subunit
MKGKHLINPMDFSVEQLDQIFELANQIISNPKEFSNICDGKILATLFYEPSTRTKFSFEAAMMKLGGKILGFSEASTSSTAKGESLSDTITMASIYSDIIAIRHPKEGSAKVASIYSSVPVINAGDGGHQHPTQTLTDLLTIKCLKGTLNNHIVGICGDLKHGRTVQSLITAMTRYKNVKFILISPKELRVPRYIREEVLNKNNIEFEEVEKIEDVIDRLDILYMTRIQKERFFNEDEYLRLRDSYILNPEKMKLAKEDMLVMHPLPRVNEIDVEVDKDKRAVYFKQAEFGMYVRMALIIKLLGVK